MRAVSSRSRLRIVVRSSETMRRNARTSDSAYPRLTCVKARSATASGVRRASRAGNIGVPELSVMQS